VRTSYPELYRLFGLYFHQGWDDRFRDEAEAMDRYAQLYPSAKLREAIDELDHLLAAEYSEPDLRRIVAKDLEANFYAPGAGLTYQQWLRNLRALLATRLARQADGVVLVDRDEGWHSSAHRALYQLLGYFHPEWRLCFPDEAHAVAEFARRYVPATQRASLAELDRVLAAPDPGRVLVADLRIDIAALGLIDGPRPWLQALRALLAERVARLPPDEPSQSGT
jgi:hypothetical protein